MRTTPLMFVYGSSRDRRPLAFTIYPVGTSREGSTTEQSTAEMHRFDLRADELAARRMRRELEDLDYDFDEETVELLKLAATELVTNALRHSLTDHVVVFVRVGPPSLLIKVCDRGPGVDGSSRQRADLFDEGGRGLFLVEHLARSWGSSKVEVDGSEWSCVWACFGAEALPGCVSA